MFWIPDFSGMTQGEAGMTYGEAGMTYGGEGMTWEKRDGFSYFTPSQ